MTATHKSNARPQDRTFPPRRLAENARRVSEVVTVKLPGYPVRAKTPMIAELKSEHDVVHVQGFAPVAVKGCEEYPNGSIVCGRGRMVLAAPHIERREYALHNVLRVEIVPTLPDRIILREREGQDLILSPKQLIGRQLDTDVTLEGHQANTPVGKVIVKAAKLLRKMIEDAGEGELQPLAPDAGSKLLRGAAVSSVQGFTVEGGEVIFAQIFRSRKAESSVMTMTLAEAEKALKAGATLSKAVEQMAARRKKIEEMERREAAIETDIARLRSAANSTSAQLKLLREALAKDAAALKMPEFAPVMGAAAPTPPPAAATTAPDVAQIATPDPEWDDLPNIETLVELDVQPSTTGEDEESEEISLLN